MNTNVKHNSHTKTPSMPKTQVASIVPIHNMIKKPKTQLDPMFERLSYQLSTSKRREEFELYSWLKPIKLLGEGSYATVYSVIDERSDKTYAIKKNKDIFINVSDAIRVLREIKLMTHFNHPNIMRLHGVIMPKCNNRDTF
eukprot:467449_1